LRIGIRFAALAAMKYLLITNADLCWSLLFLAVTIIGGALAYPGKRLRSRRRGLKWNFCLRWKKSQTIMKAILF